jgi:hypothetical protein
MGVTSFTAEEHAQHARIAVRAVIASFEVVNLAERRSGWMAAFVSIVMLLSPSRDADSAPHPGRRKPEGRNTMAIDFAQRGGFRRRSALTRR